MNMTDKYDELEARINKLSTLAGLTNKTEGVDSLDKITASWYMILKLQLELANIKLAIRDIKLEYAESKLNKFICVICMTNYRDCLLEPCSHFACCEECIKLLTGLACPVCRRSCEYYLKVFTI
jgi:hypothetical protein